MKSYGFRHSWSWNKPDSCRFWLGALFFLTKTLLYFAYLKIKGLWFEIGKICRVLQAAHLQPFSGVALVGPVFSLAITYRSAWRLGIDRHATKPLTCAHYGQIAQPKESNRNAIYFFLVRSPRFYLTNMASFPLDAPKTTIRKMVIIFYMMPEDATQLRFSTKFYKSEKESVIWFTRWWFYGESRFQSHLLFAGYFHDGWCCERSQDTNKR